MTTTQERTTETPTPDQVEIEQLRDQVRVLNQRVTDLIREKTEAEAHRDTAYDRLNNLWERLGEEADRREWCGEYDVFAANNGGPSRYTETDWSAVFQIRALTDWDLGLDNVEFPHGSAVLIRFSVSGTRDGRRDQCVCDGYSAREVAIEALNGDEVAWDDLELYEQHCDACS